MSISAKAKKLAKAPAPYHKGNVAEDLFSAAWRLIDTEGLSCLTLRRLCREVDVTAANFYNHYPSLEYLLLNVAAAGMDMFTASIKRLIKKSKSRDEALVATTLDFVEFSLAHPDLFRVMFGQVSNKTHHERYYQASEGAFVVFVKLVYGDDEDRYRIGDETWSHAHCQKAYAYFSFIYGLARLVSTQLIAFPSGTKAERTRFVRELALTFLTGIDGAAAPAKPAPAKRAAKKPAR